MINYYEALHQILKQTDLQTWTIVFILILLGFISQRFVAVFFNRLKLFTEKTDIKIDNLIINSISRPLSWIVFFIFFYFSLRFLPIPEHPKGTSNILDLVINGFVLLLTMWTSLRLTDAISEYFLGKSLKTETKLDDQIIPILRRTLKTVIILAGIVFVLQNLGYSVGSLLAGFGIGGAAIALASKDTVANLFGSIVIFIDHPFQIGDSIDIKNWRGKVEEIGLRTTRIRTYEDCIVSLPNAMFTVEPVQNRQARRKRWIHLKFGIRLDTPVSKINATTEGISKLIHDMPELREDYYMVNVEDFSESSIVLLVWVYSVTTNKLEYKKARHKFLLSILELLERLDVSLALPARSIHFEKDRDSEEFDIHD